MLLVDLATSTELLLLLVKRALVANHGSNVDRVLEVEEVIDLLFPLFRVLCRCVDFLVERGLVDLCWKIVVHVVVFILNRSLVPRVRRHSSRPLLQIRPGDV